MGPALRRDDGPIGRFIYAQKPLASPPNFFVFLLWYEEIAFSFVFIYAYKYW